MSHCIQFHYPKLQFEYAFVHHQPAVIVVVLVVLDLLLHHLLVIEVRLLLLSFYLHILFALRLTLFESFGIRLILFGNLLIVFAVQVFFDANNI